MKPVGIVRHYRTEGPGYFATYLGRCGRRWRIIRVDAGDPVPADASEFSGIAFMGGPMSVNDPLPWIDPALALIRRCVAAEIPVIGHCLGGQLMAKALGGTVTRSLTKEIGWGEVRVAPTPQALRWFGAARAFTVFHWHGETFRPPPGAAPLLSSEFCDNQAFAVGKHIAMQCHVEMSAELVETWCCCGASEIAASPGPGVQSIAEIQQDLDRRLAALHAVADRIYGRWIEGLAD